jgi:Domain of unknown function (DUF1996)
MRFIGCILCTIGLFLAGLALISPADAADSGVVSVKCSFSHRNMDDPIVFPNQPGAAHMHDFFGNQSVNALSTYDSMTSAGTTCEGEGDTAGYWIPAIIGPNGPVNAGHMNAYYRGNASTQIFPADLRMVAGATVGTPAGGDMVFWSCGQVDSSIHSPTMVNCPGDQLTATIVFPHCWDGVLTHSNDTSHVTYDSACRSGVKLPRLAFNIKWPISDGASGYNLSSDAAMGTSQGQSLHADFWNTWQQSALEATVMRCLTGGC